MIRNIIFAAASGLTTYGLTGYKTTVTFLGMPRQQAVFSDEIRIILTLGVMLLVFAYFHREQAN